MDDRHEEADGREVEERGADGQGGRRAVRDGDMGGDSGGDMGGDMGEDGEGDGVEARAQGGEEREEGEQDNTVTFSATAMKRVSQERKKDAFFDKFF